MKNAPFANPWLTNPLLDDDWSSDAEKTQEAAQDEIPCEVNKEQLPCKATST